MRTEATMTDVNAEMTCGKGLAEHSGLPAKVADVLAAMAVNLEGHMKALDPGDEVTQAERSIYAMLAARFRKVASELAAIGDEMARQRDLKPSASSLGPSRSSRPCSRFSSSATASCSARRANCEGDEPRERRWPHVARAIDVALAVAGA